MRNTPQRMRSYASPTRDKIFIRSAIVAGCGIMALLGRHAVIHRFGTDQFTGNILFAVFFVLSIGLYCGFQSVIEDLFNRLSALFRCREVMAFTETITGEQIAIPTSERSSVMPMQFSESTSEEVCIEADEIEFAEETAPSKDHSFEVLEIIDDLRHIRFSDGSEAYVGMGLSDNDILRQKAEDDLRDYEAELEEVYNEYLDSMTDEERYDHENRITRIHKEREYDEDVGFFSSVSMQDVHKNPDGTTLIEETEQEVYVTPDGSVYYLEDMGLICNFYEKYKDSIETHEEIITRKQQCDEAFNELKRHEELYNLEQVSFICAYITHTMERFMESHELDKLHNNAKIWTVNPLARFDAVQLRSNHLTKEDLKHLGYNVGKFLRLQGGVIARFVKKVFEKPFESTHVRTIEQKLRESKSTKERIPIHTADQMDKLFAHFQRYGNINPGILDKK